MEKDILEQIETLKIVLSWKLCAFKLMLLGQPDNIDPFPLFIVWYQLNNTFVLTPSI